ncbi:MAG: endopeptidase La [Ruminococcaceae bacterium]|nr:endopeptidase La [Oscillospiraceae bacterium]
MKKNNKDTVNDNENRIYTLPVFTLQNGVMFPECRAEFDVGDELSVRALKEAYEERGMILLSALKEFDKKTEPAFDDLHIYGTVCRIDTLTELPKGRCYAVLTGKIRARIVSCVQEKPAMLVNAELLSDVIIEGEEGVRYCEELKNRVQNLLGERAKLLHINEKKTIAKFGKIENFDTYAYNVGDHLTSPTEVRQKLLEAENALMRMEALVVIIGREVEYLRINYLINQRVQSDLSRQQKDIYLREQIKVIREELGEGEESEIQKYKNKLKKLEGKISEEAKTKIYDEIRKLERMPPHMPEAQISISFIELLLGLPWGEKSIDRDNIQEAREILDRDHYGMKKVKERVLEFLAVHSMKKDGSAPIICLYGPPGTGKTSIAKSIAEALGRKYVQIAMGGLHDESEIRGHRRTYIGAMPGRIIKALKDAGTCNPLMLFDEIDKISKDMRGDPSAALLEVLDGEQNSRFRDNYIDVAFDLSNVLFITTANDLSTVNPALRDRMEIIELSSYTSEEKFFIAKNHLIPRQLAYHGVNKSIVSLSDDAIKELIEGYTEEAGVRDLDRQIAKAVRKSVCLIKEENKKSYKINEKRLAEIMGPAKKRHKFNTGNGGNVGVVNGMAWTPVGGVLLSVEVNVLEGSGNIELTGRLGDVMKESAKAAISYVRSKYKELGIEADFYKTKDIHIHVPEGATPKDGPSAGVTMTTALVSALTCRKVRSDIAMTGEITLRGNVLAIGGLREKTLAAYKEGIKTVIVPSENRFDYEELAECVKEHMKIVYADNIGDVLECALLNN